MPWLRRCFLVKEILFMLRILRSPFLVGLSLIRIKHGTQDFSIYTYACRTSHAGSVNFITSASLFVNIFLIVPFYLDDLRMCPSVFEMDHPCSRGVWGYVSKVISFHGHISFYRLFNFTSRIFTYQYVSFFREQVFKNRIRFSFILLFIIKILFFGFDCVMSFKKHVIKIIWSAHGLKQLCT